MTVTSAARLIQFCYPQIYFACHTRHDRSRSSEARVSARDSAILVHLDTTRVTNLSPLARHLGLATSTLSEAVSRLSRLGYIEKTPAAGPDRRSIGLRLTEKGADAVQAGSVLETARLHAALRRVPPRDRQVICRGLARLATACRPAATTSRSR